MVESVSLHHDMLGDNNNLSREDEMLNKALESKLKSIEYHLDVARDGASNSALVVHHAQADLINTDVPHLLELVRAQSKELETKTEALKTVESIVNRWKHGELVNENGIVWREPIWPLPSGIQEISKALNKGLGNE